MNAPRAGAAWRYPLLVDLTGRLVVVVGGGGVAERRAGGVLAAGGRVRVVAPVVSERLRELGGAGRAEVLARAYGGAADLAGAALVHACTDDPGVNARVAGDAAGAGLWCVRADDAAASPAWVPAHGRVDDVTVAVSAGGDPARAARVRDEVLALLRDGRLHARPGRRSAGGGVVLVGGGPGDPDLLTLRGYRALLDADVVVTDRLGPTGLLEQLPGEVEVIDVGKAPRGPATDQATINELLVSRARAGARVVRLKGGDPFVFGRGGEELEACAAAGLAVEVVPGISSVTAAPALAGIPLTHRGVTQHFTVASGHVPPGDPRSGVDWATLARAGGTLVLVMSVENRGAIAAALLDGGMAPATPVAIVENASGGDQRVARVRLDGLGAAPAASPAVLVVGAVVTVLAGR